MLLITDGGCSAVSPIFPLIPQPFDEVIAYDINRLLRLVPFFIAIESATCLGILFYLFTDTTKSFGPTYMSGGLLAIIILRILFRKIVRLRKEKIVVVGVAPKSIWIDHALLFVTFGFGSLLIAKLNHLDLIGLNIFSMVAVLCFFLALLPILNVMVFRWRTG